MSVYSDYDFESFLMFSNSQDDKSNKTWAKVNFLFVKKTLSMHLALLAVWQ
jgi:hypothetical protein